MFQDAIMCVFLIVMKNACQACSCKDIGELQYAGMEGTVVVGMSHSTP